MKRIICDICKKEIGVTVDTSDFIIVSPCSYSFNDITPEIKTKDLCSECSNYIKEAINKAVDEITIT